MARYSYEAKWTVPRIAGSELPSDIAVEKGIFCENCGPSKVEEYVNQDVINAWEKFRVYDECLQCIRASEVKKSDRAFLANEKSRALSMARAREYRDFIARQRANRKAVDEAFRMRQEKRDESRKLNKAQREAAFQLCKKLGLLECHG